MNQDEFDDLVDKWDKAQKDGIFKNQELPNVNSQTSNNSFFGFVQTNPTDSIENLDKEYWSAINQVADDFNPGMLNEDAKGTGNDTANLELVFSKQEIENMSPDAKKDAARAIALSRNEDRVEFQGFLTRSQKQKIVDYLYKFKKKN